MISDDEYNQAMASLDAAEKIINEYHRQQLAKFAERMKTNPIFRADELVYSASARCPCGAGLAYPKGCGGNHYWDCGDILLGKADPNKEHTGKMPFSFWNVKSEEQPSASGQTTRPAHD